MIRQALFTTKALAQRRHRLLPPKDGQAGWRNAYKEMDVHRGDGAIAHDVSWRLRTGSAEMVGRGLRLLPHRRSNRTEMSGDSGLFGRQQDDVQRRRPDTTLEHGWHRQRREAVLF